MLYSIQNAIQQRGEPDMSAKETTTEPVWSYRGYQLKSSEFTTAMVHFYRGEVSRSNVWRQRLDNTTNWAVITAGAAISFALGSPANHHGVILLNTLLITLFLYLEARRYRYYELFASRVRLMETDFFATMLVPPFGPAADWAESLAENLLQPHFTISMWEAFGRRFRRNYLWIYVILAGAWILKGFLFPTPAATWTELTARTAVGTIPGEIVMIIGAAFMGALFFIGVATIGLRQASGEVLPRYADSGLAQSLSHLFERDEEHGDRQPRQPWYRRTSKRPQLVSLIVSQNCETLGGAILTQLKRGVTRLAGVGMYTGTEHDVLMTALTLSEVSHLKAIVSENDPQAFVVVMPAEEVLGRGFQSLHDEAAMSRA
jgi:uncharacterized membrane protein